MNEKSDPQVAKAARGQLSALDEGIKILQQRADGLRAMLEPERVDRSVYWPDDETRARWEAAVVDAAYAAATGSHGTCKVIGARIVTSKGAIQLVIEASGSGVPLEPVG